MRCTVQHEQLEQARVEEKTLNPRLLCSTQYMERRDESSPTGLLVQLTNPCVHSK